MDDGADWKWRGANGHAKSDLAVANAFSNDVSILLGNGNGSFAAAVNYPAGAAPISILRL